MSAVWASSSDICSCVYVDIHTLSSWESEAVNLGSSMGMSRVSKALINASEEVQHVCACVCLVWERDANSYTHSTAIMEGRMTYRQRADMHDWLFHTLMEDGHHYSDWSYKRQVRVSITDTNQCSYKQTTAKSGCCTSILWLANSPAAEVYVSFFKSNVIPLIIRDSFLFLFCFIRKWQLEREMGKAGDLTDLMRHK